MKKKILQKTLYRNTEENNKNSADFGGVKKELKKRRPISIHHKFLSKNSAYFLSQIY